MAPEWMTLDTIARRMQFKDDRITRALEKIAAKEQEMTDRLALATVPAPSRTVTPDELDLVRRTIAKDATPDELKLYLYDCARQGVHPLDKLIHFTKRSNKYTPVTSIDFLRIRAADSGECVGIDDATFSGSLTIKDPNFTATVTVYRLVQGQRAPFTATARWSEYKPDQDFMWKKMPHVMLGKCAEALALRKAFPKQLSGLYVREEMEQAGPPVPIGLSRGGVASGVEPGATAAAEGPAVPAPPADRSAVTPAMVDEIQQRVHLAADLNVGIPDAWKPFVAEQSEYVRGVIAAVDSETRTGKKSGKPFTKYTITMSTGEELTTLDGELAATARDCFQRVTPVEIRTQASRFGRELVTIGRVPSESDDAAF